MANRNVDLLIRAKDSASRAFKSVTGAMDDLSTVQEAVAAQANKVDDALGRSTTAAKQAAAAIGNDVTKGVEKAVQVFERIEKTVADSSRQFEKQKSDLSENREAYKALGKQAEAAAAAIKRSEDKIGPQTQAQTERLKIMRGAYRSLNTEIGKMTPRLNRQENALADNAKELDRIRNAAIAASSALRTVTQTGARATGVSDKSAQTNAANAAARKGMDYLVKAERAIQIEINARQAATEAAATAADAANQKIVNSVQEVVKAEERLAAIQARRAASEKAAGVNAQAKAGLAGITAGLIANSRAQEANAAAAEASRRTQAALAASYQKQRAAARPAQTEQRKLAAAFRESLTAAQQARTPFAQLVREITRIGPAADSGAQGMRRLSGGMANGRQTFRAFYGDSRRALSVMQRLRGEVLSLTASFVGFYGVFNVGSGILDSFQRLEAAQNRLGAAFDQDYDKVNDELARLNAEASRLGISFDVLASNYSNFLISGQQAGLEVDQLRTIFRQVSEAGRVLKLSNEQIEGTFNAMIQIAGKGTLQMEELRQQLGDRLPGAVGLLAKALGYGKDELAQFYKDVTNGAVGAEDALVALGQGLEDQYGGQLEKALDSVTAKIGNLQNLLFQRQLTSANSGFIDGLETALEALNAWLDSPEGIEFFESLGAAFGRMFEVLPVVLDNMGTLIGLFQVFAAIKVGQVVAGLSANLTRLGSVSVGNLRVQVALNRAVAAFSPAAAKALTSATSLGAGLRGVRAIVAGMAVTFKAAFASIGGIIGIAAAALSFFAFEAIASTDSTDALTAALSDADDTIGVVGAAFRSAAGDAELFRAKLDEINHLDIRLDLKNLKEQQDAILNGTRDAMTGMGKEVAKIWLSLMTSGADRRITSQFSTLIAKFDAGKISAAKLRDGLNDLSREFDELASVPGLDDFLGFVDSMAAADEKIARLEAELAVIEGTATEAQEALLGLVSATAETGHVATAAEKQMTAFEKAMRELGELIPHVNEKLEEFDAIREIEANFEAAMKAADAFTDAAQRAAAIGQAVDLRNRALADHRGRTTNFEAQYTAGRGTPQGAEMAELVAAAVREGLRLGIDADALLTAISYETGGTFDPWQKGPTTQWGEHRGLIQWGEPQREQYGVNAETSISDQMRAVGDYLIDAGVKSGDGLLQVYAAINAGDASKVNASDANNGGAPGTVLDKVNDQMSGHEARAEGLLAAYAGLSETEEERIKTAEKLAEKQAEYRAGLAEEIAEAEFLTSIEGQRMIDQEVAKAQQEAINEAKKVSVTLTKEELAEIERVTRAKYATKQAEEDRTTQLEEAKKLEEAVTLLQERRRYLAEQITLLEGNGDMVGAAKISEELLAVDEQLDSAIEKALAFWEAMGGEGSERAILALKSTQQELRATESTAITTGKQINDMFANRIASAIDSFSQRVANGENVMQAFKAEFMKMAADILIQLGQMIIQQAIFNMLAGAFGGGASGSGGVGGGIAGLINGLFHNGGTVGAGSMRSSRKISPALFANAVRYHSGGIAGLAPDEMGAILKKNEEILTETDPRHRFNGGASGGGSGKTGMTIINAFDAEEMMERALSSPRGEEIFLNTVRGNNTEIKAALDL